MSHPTATGSFQSPRTSAANATAPAQDPTTSKTHAGTRETLQTIADTVGMVPSMRSQDSAAQGIALVFGLIAGAIIGWTIHGTKGLLIGGIGGLVTALVISGLIVMVMGWIRVAKKL